MVSTSLVVLFIKLAKKKKIVRVLVNLSLNDDLVLFLMNVSFLVSFKNS